MVHCRENHCRGSGSAELHFPKINISPSLSLISKNLTLSSPSLPLRSSLLLRPPQLPPPPAIITLITAFIELRPSPHGAPAISPSSFISLSPTNPSLSNLSSPTTSNPSPTTSTSSPTNPLSTTPNSSPTTSNPSSNSSTVYDVTTESHLFIVTAGEGC